MTRTSFIKALHKEAPGLLSDLSGTRHAANGTPVAFKVEPESDQVRLILKLGDNDPHDLRFATEADAAKFLGRGYKAVKLWESALSLLLR